MAACKAFHSMPEDLKHSLKWKNHNPDNNNIYRGLAPFVDNDPSHKELFDMGQDIDEISPEERKYCLYERTPFPPQEEYAGVLKVFKEQQ